MFRELHHMDRSQRTMDLAETMAEQRNRALAATRRPSLRARMTRMLFALTVATESSPAEGHA